MTKEEQYGPKFTIGDDFTGFKKIVHDILMQNELYDGYGAYRVSYADTQDPENKSGLSFGGNQMDMSKRSEAVSCFVDILKNAKNKKGDLFFTTPEVLKICGGIENTNIKQTGKTPEQIFGGNLPLVNAALGSDYGIKKINAIYLESIDHDIAHVEKAVEYMSPNPAAQKFYSTDYGKTLLFDYHNQFGLNLEGKGAVFINNYINGSANGMQKTDFATKEKYCAPTDYYDLSDHTKYMHSTEQWSKTPKMVDNRLNNTVYILEKQYGLTGYTEPLKALVWGEDASYSLDNLSAYEYFDDGKQCGLRPINTDVDNTHNNVKENWQDAYSNPDPILEHIAQNTTPNIYETACLLNNTPYPLGDNTLSNNIYYAQIDNFNINTWSPSASFSNYNPEFYNTPSFTPPTVDLSVGYTPSYTPTNYNVVANYDWSNSYNIGWGGYSLFGMKPEQSSHTFSFKNQNSNSKRFCLKEVLDMESSLESSSTELLLGVPMIDIINTLDRGLLAEMQDYRFSDALKDTFEISQTIH